jgi:hypothetical protein
VDRAIGTSASLGLDTFVRAWSAGHTARLDQNATKALLYFQAGASKTHGLDRTELLCEAATLLLHQATAVGLPDETRTASARTVVGYLNEVDALLRAHPTGQQRQRAEYLTLYLRGLRGLVYIAQGRHEDARARLAEVIERAGDRSSLRARRLAHALRIEELRNVAVLDGATTFAAEVARVQSVTALPGLRLRLVEIADAERGRQDAVRREGAAAQERKAQAASSTPVPAEAAPVPEEEDRIALDGSTVRAVARPATAPARSPAPTRSPTRRLSPHPELDLIMPTLRADDDDEPTPVAGAELSCPGAPTPLPQRSRTGPSSRRATSRMSSAL